MWIIAIEDIKFTSLKKAVEWCEEEYGYEGSEWDMVKEDEEDLVDFLNDDGVYSTLEYKEGLA